MLHWFLRIWRIVSVTTYCSTTINMHSIDTDWSLFLVVRCFFRMALISWLQFPLQNQGCWHPKIFRFCREILYLYFATKSKTIKHHWPASTKKSSILGCPPKGSWFCNDSPWRVFSFFWFWKEIDLVEKNLIIFQGLWFCSGQPPEEIQILDSVVILFSWNHLSLDPSDLDSVVLRDAEMKGLWFCKG